MRTPVDVQVWRLSVLFLVGAVSVPISVLSSLPGDLPPKEFWLSPA